MNTTLQHPMVQPDSKGNRPTASDEVVGSPNSRRTEPPGRLGETTLPPIRALGRDAAPSASGVGIGAGTPSCGGFTLIEVLASMAVLVVLILALTRMFMEAAGITRRGTTALMRNSTGETAMETLMQDAEGMVVNDRLACYVEADVSYAGPNKFGFDDVWFISTAGDQDDDLPYEYCHYFVTNRIFTNALGAAYMRFDLIKARMIFAVGDNNGFYALDTSSTRWWNLAKSSGANWDQQVLADNVVRFDIYCLGWDGQGWMAGSGGLHVFDSTEGPRIPGLTPAQKEKYKNVPPASFDIYLQITSPEAAVEGGMALVEGVPEPDQLKARELMIRESASLFGRAVPITGAGRYNTAVVYGTNNTTYYAP